LNTQQADGDWQEEQFTGTGFPKVFYLKYHLYSLYFPLMALARYAKAVNLRLESLWGKMDRTLEAKGGSPLFRTDSETPIYPNIRLFKE
jgi:hypothetical protein